MRQGPITLLLAYSIASCLLFPLLNGLRMPLGGASLALRRSLDLSMAAEGVSWSTATKGMSQTELMAKDECLLVDEDDQIIGSASKFDAHRFTPGEPSGLLHRAFSVFLFNEKDELLLQQRASHKITFPNVWTNTCCSHPLSGYTPDEVDDAEAVASGNVKGIMAAAQRKLEHELGIDCHSNLPIENIRYIGRIHYSAPMSASSTSNMPEDPYTEKDGGHWGESEIDYVLFGRIREEQLRKSLEPNPEEVREYKFVTQEVLQEMMADPTLQWSPWFRLLAQTSLPTWWGDLENAIETSKYTDLNTIQRLLS